MYFVGIDISKYKYYCFIYTKIGEVIEKKFIFKFSKKMYLFSIAIHLLYI